MTGTFELCDAARERGVDAAVVPTGQTGIAIADWGIAVDRVVSDFAAGAVEQMIHEEGDRDLLLVEGQGALAHPAYSGVTLSILHGAQPDGLVLCHEAGRDRVHGYESFAIPPVETVVSLYEDFARPVHETEVAAGALNTSHLGDDEARRAIEEYAGAIDAPATDPVRFDADGIIEALV